MSCPSLKELWGELGAREAITEAEFRAWRQHSWRSTLILHKFTDAILCMTTPLSFGWVWYQNLPLWVFLFNMFIWNFTSFCHTATLLAVRNNASVMVQKKWYYASQISMFAVIIVFHYVVIKYKAHPPVMEFFVQLMAMALNVLVGQFDAVGGTVLLVLEFIFYICFRKYVEMADNKSAGFLFVCVVFLPVIISFIQEAYQRRMFMEKYYPYVIKSREQLQNLMPFGESIKSVTQLPQKGKDFQYILMLGGLVVYVSMSEWERIQRLEVKTPGLITFVCVICVFMYFELVLKVAKQPTCRCSRQEDANKKIPKQNSWSSYGSSRSSGSLDINQLLQCKMRGNYEDFSKLEKLKGCCSNDQQEIKNFGSESSFSIDQKLEKSGSLQKLNGIDCSQQFIAPKSSYNGDQVCCETAKIEHQQTSPAGSIASNSFGVVAPEIQSEEIQFLPQSQMTYQELQQNTAQMRMTIQYLQQKMNSIGLNLHVMQSSNQILNIDDDNNSQDYEEEEEFDFSEQEVSKG